MAASGASGGSSDGGDRDAAAPSPDSHSGEHQAPDAAEDVRPEGEAGPPRAGLTDTIARLMEERTALKTEKARVLKDLRNAKRRNSRLKKRTRQLSSNDLLEVLAQRQASANAHT